MPLLSCPRRVHIWHLLRVQPRSVAPKVQSSGLQAMARPQLVLFGDSITQFSFDVRGWGALLAHAYQRKADVVNRGFSGYNSSWALHGMTKLFPPGGLPPHLLTIFFGANDAALPDRASARQHVPLDQYAANLRAMVERGRALGARNIVLITPPPVDEAARVSSNEQRFGVVQEPERSNAVAGKYAAACCEVARAMNVPVLDLYTQFQARPEWRSRLLSDGLHLSQEGSTVVYELLQQLIDRECQGIRVEQLPLDLPLHSDIADPHDFAPAFREFM